MTPCPYQIGATLPRNNGKHWLLSPGTSSQNEGYNSKWLICLVCREPLLLYSIICEVESCILRAALLWDLTVKLCVALDIFAHGIATLPHVYV